MKVTRDNGSTLDLGITEVAPTVGITDYSRRVTDDFGVTTVVRRGFARRMTLRFALDYTAVDTVQAQLADLRATPALWVADDRFRALAIRGIYKDFDVDLAVPPQSYCSLTVEGLTEADVQPDPGDDPAVAGMVSTLRLIQPVTIDDSVLVASNVPENDAPIWSRVTHYGQAARVVAGHRVFDSLIAGNVGNDPLTSTGKWIEVGPTNRWAAFDQALGTVMAAAGPIIVQLATGPADALALLDVTAATVRVQASGYDRMQGVSPGALTFTDLPGGAVTVTIAGPGTVSVGTLLVGRMVALGVTEASPTAGITDYSRKDVDDFGEVTIVQRAWSKRMSARALIRSDAVDMVFDRIAALRAVPALWIGDADSAALTIYGFFKDFSIELGESVSKLSLSIEGLSAAAKVAPLGAGVVWNDIADPEGNKPANNATNSADPTSPFGPDGGTVRDVLDQGVALVDLTKTVADAKATIDSAREDIDAARSDIDSTLVEAGRLKDVSRQTLIGVMRTQLLDDARRQLLDARTKTANGATVVASVGRVERQQKSDQAATAERIDMVVASIGLPDGKTVAGEIVRVDKAVVDGDKASADAIAAVGAKIGLPDGKTVAGEIVRVDKAVVDGDKASADAIVAVGARIGLPDGKTVAGEITRVDKAVADGATATSSALSDVRASITPGALVVAAGEGLAAWTATRQLAPAASPTLAEYSAALVTDNVLGAAIEWRPTTAGQNIGGKRLQRLMPGRQYQIRVPYRVVAGDGSADLSLALVFVDAAYGSPGYIFTSAQAAAGTGAQEYVLTIGDVAGPGVDVVWPVGAVYLRPMHRLASAEAGLVLRTALIEIRDVKLDKRMSAEVTRLDKAVVDGDAAQAQALSSVKAGLESTIGSVDGRVTDEVVARTAEVTRLDNVKVDAAGASAAAQTVVDAKVGDMAGVTVREALNAQATRLGKVEGTYTIAIDAGGNLVGIQLVGGTAGPGALNLINADLNMGTGRITFANESYMRVQGIGFGDGGKFIDWYGPRLSSLSQCTETNAIVYMTNDGRSMWRGGLNSSAGTSDYTFSHVGTSAGVPTTVMTPSWPTMGRKKRVTASYYFLRTGRRKGTNFASGSPSAALALYRTIGSQPEQGITSFSGSGTVEYAEAGQGEYTNFIETISGTFVFEDTSTVPDPRTWRVTLNARTLSTITGAAPEPDQITQRITITSVEQ